MLRPEALGLSGPGDIIVLKFGSSVLRSSADFPTAAHEVYRWYRANWRVVVVVSAVGDATDGLFSAARALWPDPEANATAELLATGERQSAALLGIALDRVGIPARVVDPREFQLMVDGKPLDSEPIGADRSRLHTLLDESPVIVVPGFFGYSNCGRVHLLGRGGSDLSAVYLAMALKANRCRLVKDVDGVYERDPALEGPAPARRFVTLGYANAVERAAQLIQPKAVHFLQRGSACAEVAGVASAYETLVGNLECRLAASTKVPPLSVLILGLGVVGFGVYQRLAALPQHFRVVRALVRDCAKHVARGVPRELLCDSLVDAMDVRADVVVDALGPSSESSYAIARHFLGMGASVVSANKKLIAECGVDLTAHATRHCASLHYAAAVGGSAPMLEAVRRLSKQGEIRSIAGILNGTCNHVLDALMSGLSLDDAVQDAQRLGFAESNPAEDLLGRDAERKLRILARHAFGEEMRVIAVEPLTATALQVHRAMVRPTEVPRLVARAWRMGALVFGQIKLEWLNAASPLARVTGEWNRLVLTLDGGADTIVNGRGAGRWPTTEAVMADLLDVRFAHEASSTAASDEQTAEIPQVGPLVTSC